MEKITLYSFHGSGIKITMELYFNEQEQLIFEGYDVGPMVEEAWGDLDYEYFYTIEPEEVKKFYPLFHLHIGDKTALLQSLKNRFSINEAYSQFGKFMNENEIVYEKFTYA
ncbi:MAG: hypothetical protein H7A25_15625 [Leptospiraceae bacterium]|nr:hypothetical protein [Leptospiraceae bacterium]MCP5501330.1 hypothetical protein [Leptospiraceae bacterium]